MLQIIGNHTALTKGNYLSDKKEQKVINESRRKEREGIFSVHLDVVSFGTISYF